MKINNLSGLFDEQNVLQKLTRLGDPLVLIDHHIDFELFRSDLLDFVGRKAPVLGGKLGRGRPAFDVLVMIKALFLQRLFNLSDEQLEFQINDRMSFRRFLHIPFSNAMPDSNTLWTFREHLNGAGEDRARVLFDRFLAQLNQNGFIAKEGKMLDATIISVPRQRNSPEDNETIKAGNIPASFREKPAKLAQKDTDARWTQKHNTRYYGYKNHVLADVKTKFITYFKVTSASVHDSVPACELLEKAGKGEDFYADSAYQSPEIKAKLTELEMTPQLIERAYKNKPLTDAQKESNNTKSKKRARVEHIFGFMQNSMNNGTFMRNIGMARAQVVIGLNNWVYNLCRFVQIQKMSPAIAMA